ncbi:MAG: dolichyl-phosphate beta-glucosyltransferase [Planctomycetota bacterium]|jgi:dolichyl-phosphate beta-glucosyltransferase
MDGSRNNGGMLSVVIPAYNEERRLPASLERVLSYLRARNTAFEVLIVDDGSTDATARIAEDFATRERGVRILRHEHNQGKGHAVRTGMLEARGDYIIFTDADLSTPIETTSDFMLHLTNGSDVVVGNRRMRRSNLEVRQPRHREFLGRIFTRITRLLLRSPITDQTCGFKGFKRKAALETFSRQSVFNWSFDAEILHIAARRGMTVRQIPVRWRDEPGSKVRVISACISSFLGLVKIWCNGITGRYN